MKVKYQYASPSMCLQQEGHTTLGLSTELSREERVSFHGKLKNPLIFRDSMLMLREIVISDTRQAKKERIEFFTWLDEEIERRVQEHDKYLPNIRKDLQDAMENTSGRISKIESELLGLQQIKKDLQKEIESHDAWKDYYKLERKFWEFVKGRDQDLWYVLDPVITVHPDMVSFEAFSLDESVYGCLSVNMDEFEMLKEPILGTTNIDFSYKLAKEMERFRTYSNVELSVNPDGFTVDTGIIPEYMEKKIDLPETWVKGFNQVSSAANLQGISVKLTPVDMYDICSFMRRHKENKSPRYMKWILKTNEPIRIVFEPFGTELVLHSIYLGNKNREEKIWGRRRWLVIEKLIPLANAFEVKLLGFGMPQFIIADLGNIKMAIGFTSWSSNDWVKGTAFNIMSGFIGDGNYKGVYDLLREKRFLSVNDICNKLDEKTKKENISGIGSLLKRGEGYVDVVNNIIRFRKLYSEPIPKELYETTPTELAVAELVELGLEHFRVKMVASNEYIFTNSYKSLAITNPSTGNNMFNTKIIIDEDGQICKLECNCKEFKKGSRNISSPCAHILALYMVCAKFTRLEFEQEKEYKINDIMEVLL